MDSRRLRLAGASSEPLNVIGHPRTGWSTNWEDHERTGAVDSHRS
jgi:hypothetical protein